MHPIEQEMLADLKVMYQTGKGNDHLVPVLVPTDVAPALCLLSRPDNRKAADMSADNYLFPVVHAGGDHCSGYHSVCRAVTLSGVEDCASITATKMRHYSSTQYWMCHRASVHISISTWANSSTSMKQFFKRLWPRQKLLSSANFYSRSTKVP